MSQSHVPKFGNWDGDNIPYTAYFENARIEKVGGMRINPNDPEENPEAFNLGQFGDGNTSIPVRISPDKPVTTKKFHRVQQKGSSHKCIGSESGSDRNMTDNTFAQPHHQSGRSGRNNSSTESQISPSQKQSYVDDFSQRSVSVPKFGGWNDTDRRSGEGFTVIFNKVKEEKHMAAAKFPPAPVQTANSHSTSHKKATSTKRCCCLF
ncbi:Hypothetical predicted protein [Olea europaea subsp. europaea]|uniref:RIN4 pathogenic type III effector avirulence factor Avr cleavage site domain-containing protein n=1 Tax=Olea europaea subsp. europaea TaxID=158383 RepID=A0A8S0PW38_OLEEU|nr:Hypothetical predicted protein [Olea europaea subsp. europaea]